MAANDYANLVKYFHIFSPRGMTFFLIQKDFSRVTAGSKVKDGLLIPVARDLLEE